MQGYKTWTGIIITILGLFGWGGLISEAQLGDLISWTSQIVGLILTVYGNYKAHREINKLGGYKN